MNFGLKAFKWIKVSQRDRNVQTKCKTRCRNLYDRCSNEDVKKIVLTDGKDFSLKVARNRQNDKESTRLKRRLSLLLTFVMNLLASQIRLWFPLEFIGMAKLTYIP